MISEFLKEIRITKLYSCIKSKSLVAYIFNDEVGIYVGIIGQHSVRKIYSNFLLMFFSGKI